MKNYTNIFQYGNNLLVRTHGGGRHRVPFSPSLYIKSNEQESEWSTVFGDRVQEVKPGNIWETRQFIDRYKDVEGFDLYGNTNYIQQFITETYPDEITPELKKLKTCFIDIEVAADKGFPDVNKAAEEILLITVRDKSRKTNITFSAKDVSRKLNTKMIVANTEREMLVEFIRFWQDYKPDIVSGWNSKLFDMPYLINRINRVLNEENGKNFVNILSPWSVIRSNTISYQGEALTVYNIAGISQLDYLDLYKKYTYKARESYKLDNIAEVELNQKKLDHSEYDSFKDFYENNWDKFVEYNIIDTELVEKLDDKMKLIDLVVTIAYQAKVNYEDVFSQVKTWEALIYNHLHKKNKVVPIKSAGIKTSQFAGAYVKDPQVGMHDWVVSFDLQSLYPHLIMQYNLSPETLVREQSISVSVPDLLNRKEYTIPPEYSMAANGKFFRKDHYGFLPELMDEIFTERKAAKSKMLEMKKNKEPEDIVKSWDVKQQALKILANSGYGALGSEYFAWFNIDIAEAITYSGQLSIQWVERAVNEFLNQELVTNNEDYVVAGDTESIYICMEKLVRV